MPEPVMIPLDKIRPPREPNSAHKRDWLIKCMQARGWEGRPLLIIEVVTGEPYRALTGSHRYDAATKVRLSPIPCLVIDADRWRESGLDFETVLHMEESVRVRALRSVGLDDAADLCELEIRGG